MSADDPEWSHFLESAFLAVLETCGEGIFVFDADGQCRMIGRRAGEMFGIEPAGYVGKSTKDVLVTLSQACEEPEAFLEALGANTAQPASRAVAEIDIRRPRPRTLEWSTLPMLRDGTLRGRLALVRDVTRERSLERSQKQLQARIQELTPLDTLTGLVNARRFREELEREHGRSSRAWDSYAVVRIDVDGMGAINDELGNPVGDQVLEQVAEKLKACRREYDILARLDADEFVILLPGADKIAANAVGERMLKAVGGHAFGLPDSRRVTVSGGGCVWVPPSAENGEDILRKAGELLLDARGHGVGKLVVDASAPGSDPPPREAT
jgi:diguanylate cyclase (GGDEF)-like protein/PAS domain S-box-containing protein